MCFYYEGNIIVMSYCLLVWHRTSDYHVYSSLLSLVSPATQNCKLAYVHYSCLKTLDLKQHFV